jgi:hypothetical protein
MEEINLGLVEIINNKLKELIKNYSNELLVIVETRGIDEIKEKLKKDSI